MSAQIGNHLLKALDIVVMHVALVFVKSICDYRLLFLQRTTEPLIVDLCERLTFNFVFQTWTFGVIESTLRTPENRILGFCVEYDAIKVEKCGFE